VIGIVDYGVGNVRAFANVYRQLGFRVAIVSTPDELRRAEKLILPGVGAFDWAMTRLNESGLRNVLEELVMRERRPVLGVCVGMQMMADRSAEGVLEGLGWIRGEVKRFDDSRFNQATHLPHMGWNDVRPEGKNDLFRDLEEGARFYFLHSYYLAPDNQDHVLATTDYGGSFAASVRCGNVGGVQFHPEKSHHWGVQLLRNFAEM
jgi:glutamine amidotransferase